MKFLSFSMFYALALVPSAPLVAAAFPEQRLNDNSRKSSVGCAYSLQALAAKAVARHLYRCGDGIIAQKLAALTESERRLPQSYFINSVLMERIGRRQKKLNIALDEVQEEMLAEGLKLACGDSGRLLFTGSRDGAVRMWNTDDGSMKTLHYCRSGVASIACSSDDSKLFFSLLGGGLLVFDLKNFLQNFMAGGVCSPIACSADGNRFFAGRKNGIRLMLDRRSGTFRRVSKKIERSVPVAALACDGKGDRLFSANGLLFFTVCLIGEKDKVRPSSIHDSRIFALACTGDGKRVFSGTNKGTIYESREKDSYGKLHVIGKTSVDKGPGRVSSLACSADGSRLFSASPGLLAMWTDYMQDLSTLDAEALERLFQVAQVWRETGKPLFIDLADEQWTRLLARLPYLQHEKLFVRPAE